MPRGLSRRDDVVCDLCIERLGETLDSLLGSDGLLADLEAVRARQTSRPRMVGGGGKREKPVPFDPRVANVLARLEAALQRLALEVWSRHDVPLAAAGAADLADYLQRRITWGVQSSDRAPELLDRLDAAVAETQRLVDGPHARQYLGECGSTDDAGGDRCTEQLRAPPGQTAVHCPRCGARWNVAQRQEWMLGATGELLMTLWAMAEASSDEPGSLFGERVSVHRLNGLRRWGKVLPMHGPWPRFQKQPRPGAQLYRVADVRAALLGERRNRLAVATERASLSRAEAIAAFAARLRGERVSR